MTIPAFRHATAAVKAAVALAAWNRRGDITALAAQHRVDPGEVGEWLDRLTRATARWPWRSRQGWWL